MTKRKIPVTTAMLLLAMTHFLWVCGAYAQTYYPDPPMAPGALIGDREFSEVIDPYSGTLTIVHTDVVLPGNGGMDLKVQRVFRQKEHWLDSIEPVGMWWSVHFGRIRGYVNPSFGDAACTQNLAELELQLPDGTIHDLIHTNGTTPGTSGQPFTPKLWKLSCNVASFKLASPEGDIYEMDQLSLAGAGADPYLWYRYPTRITDRNGNVITFTYRNSPLHPTGSVKLVDRVASSDGRYLQFSYDSQGHVLTIDANGRTWTYRYGGYDLLAEAGFVRPPGAHRYDWLSEVEGPEGFRWRYEKHPGQGSINQAVDYSPGRAKAWRMKTITFPHGGTVTYDYAWSNAITLYEVGDFGLRFPYDWRYPVLVSKQKSDGSNWAYSYQFSNAVGILDVTTVSGPDGNVTYKHYGLKSVSTSDYWRMGTLDTLTRGSDEVITLQWASQHISGDALLWRTTATPSIVYGLYRPLLTNKTVTRGSATFSSTYSNFDGFGFPGTITETFSENGASVASRTTTPTFYNNTTRWIVGKVQNETVTGGGSVTRVFDPVNGNLSSITKLCVTTAYTYEPNGNLATKPTPMARSRVIPITNLVSHKPSRMPMVSTPCASSITLATSPAVPTHAGLPPTIRSMH